jgi:hypothetical protein
MRILYLFYFGFVKGNLKFLTLLIGAEGEKTKAPRWLPGPPAESKAPGAKIDNQF